MNIQNHIFKMNDNLDEINIWGETLFVCYILLINMEEFLLSYPHGYEGFHILCLGKTRKIKIIKVNFATIMKYQILNKLLIL